MKSKMGVVELFFGPPWSISKRNSYASFLASAGYDYFWYAPKADGNLRKQWRKPWGKEYLEFLANLGTAFHRQDLEFGICLSPFGLQEEFSKSDQSALAEKLHLLESLGVNTIGIFFDDMPSSQGLAKRQLEVIDFTLTKTKTKIVFCPSYYTPDPILDRVFGQRPEGYLDEISKLPESVEILWTGPKVISPDIPAHHLNQVSQILKRKPFLCDNIFANDGPRNCKFLKIKPFSGRDPKARENANGWVLNPMNQAELSKIVLLSAIYTMQSRANPLESAALDLCGPQLSALILKYQSNFLVQGLDKIAVELKAQIHREFMAFSHPVAIEIVDWLEGRYTVGSECLTD